MLGIEILIKNASYEVLEDGVNFKVFGITYLCTEQRLAQTILFLLNLDERIKILRKEKKELEQISPGT